MMDIGMLTTLSKRHKIQRITLTASRGITQDGTVIKFRATQSTRALYIIIFVYVIIWYYKDGVVELFLHRYNTIILYWLVGREDFHWWSLPYIIICVYHNTVTVENLSKDSAFADRWSSNTLQLNFMDAYDVLT